MPSKLSSYFFFAVLLGLLYEAACILEPFKGPLVCAIATGVVFFPHYRRIERWFPKWPAWLRAALSDLAVVLFFIVPIGLLVWAIVAEVDAVTPFVKTGVEKVSIWIKSNPSNSPAMLHLPYVIRKQLDMSSSQVQDRLGGLANRSVEGLARLGTLLATHMFGMILQLLIFVIVLFFIFRDGDAMLKRWNALLPLRAENRKAINAKLHLTMVGVVRGTFLTALIQGLTSAIGFLIVGTGAAFFLGFLTALATLIPSVGTALVWVPVSIYYFLAGSYFKGGFVVAWGILVVGVVDNLARPLLVGAGVDVPFLWLFLGLLGGLEVFGPIGIILGPLILGVIPTLFEIYRREYLERERLSSV